MAAAGRTWAALALLLTAGAPLLASAQPAPAPPQGGAPAKPAAVGREEADKAMEALAQGKVKAAAVTEILHRLAAADPANAALRRQEVAALDHVAALALAASDLDGARQAYAEQLDALTALSDAAPDDVAILREMAMCLGRTSDVLLHMNQMTAARQSAEMGLTLARNLSDADPKNDALKHDAAASLEQLGAVLGAQDDVAGARKALGDGLALRRILAADHPADAGMQRELAAALFQMAGVPDSDVPWSDVVAQLRSMRQKGQLQPADEHFLTEAEAHAAQPAGK